MRISRYAKKAIAHRADGYLLKPVDEEEMISYLKKIGEDYRQEDEKRRWDRLSEKWTKNVLVHSLLTQPWKEEKFSLEGKAESLGLKSKEYQVMLVVIHARPGEAVDAGLLAEAELRIADYFERSGSGVPFTVQSQTGILLSSGRVLGLTSVEWEYQNAENALKAAGKDDYTYAHFPVTMGEQYKDHSMQSIGVDGYGISITTACKDPVRAIKFLDWLSSDEGQVLRNWGIEGKQYTVENGKRVIPDDVFNQKINDAANFAKQTGIGLYPIFGVRYGDGVKDSTGNYYTTNFPEQIVAGYSEPEKEALAAYDATTWKDLFPSEKDFPVKEWGALYNMPVPTDGDYQIIYQKTQDIVKKRIPEAILAKPADFDKVYDGFIDELNKAGAEKMESEYTELVKARVSLFTSKDVQ